MKPRHAYRLTAKVRANAELCGRAAAEWLALTRDERKRRLSAAKKGARRG